MIMQQGGYTCGVLTVSDRGAAGQRQDTSGPRLRHMLQDRGYSVVAYGVVPDDPEVIVATLVQWVDDQGVDLLVTTGGTGVAPRDVTPEATRTVVEREIPGISEAMRMASLGKTVHGMLSRGIAGIRRTSLIINLPGSEKGAEENLASIIEALPHALYKIKGGQDDCAAGGD